MIPNQWIEEASERIAPYIVETPLTWDAERQIYLKWENRQVTGSFKARGALNKVLSLADWERASGLVAASAGNHGQGVALAGRLTGVGVEVFVPSHTGPAKIASMRSMGAHVQVVEGGYPEAEHAAGTYAQQHGRTFVSPYNDPQVIAGQATLASESLRQIANAETNGPGAEALTWIVPVGGGGLISGSGAVLGREQARPRIIGVQPEASPFTYRLFHGQPQEDVEDRPTLAEGLSGSIDPASVTIPLMRQHVDDIVLVSEDQIRQAITLAWRTYGERIEGSAAVGLAAVLFGKVKGGPFLVVITGGNIEDDLHSEIIARHLSQVKN